MATLEEQSVTVEQVLARWGEQGIRNVRFELPDMHGTSRSKLVPIEHAGKYAETGLTMYGGVVVLDSRSDVVPGTLYNEEVSHADQRLKPDPATAAIPHQWNGMLCRQERAGDIDRDSGLPPLQRQLREPRCAGDSRVVHQHVASAEMISKPLEQRRYRLRRRDVHMPATPLTTGGRDVARNCFGPLTVKITDDDHETVRRQSTSNCFTYAGRTAGDYYYT